MTSNHLKRVHFWIFGPELGCLTREISIIDHFLNQDGVRVKLFVHQHHLKFLADLYGDKVDTVSYGNSLQLIYKDNFDMDIRRTVFSVFRYTFLNSWYQFYLFKKSLKDNPLIITDFLPHIVFFGKWLHRPVIGIYNYALEYTRIGPGWINSFISKLMKYFFTLSYKTVEHMFIEQIFPTKELDSIKYVTPIARSVTRHREEIHRELDIDATKELIFLSIGGNSNPEPLLEKFHSLIENKDYQFLILPRAKEEIPEFKRRFPKFIIPNKPIYDSQNYICSCDLIIGKAGFGTVGEILKNNCKLLPLHLENHPEIGETERNLLKNKLVTDTILDSDTIDIIAEKIDRALLDSICLENIKSISCSGEKEILDILEKAYPDYFKS